MYNYSNNHFLLDFSKMSRINIEVPNADHQRLKIIAAALSISIKDIVLSAIRDKIAMQLEKTPNELTIQAFTESETGVGLTKHTSMLELFKDLGLDDEKKH
jgi:hypothetical protein